MRRSIFWVGIGILLAVLLLEIVPHYFDGAAIVETTGVVKELTGRSEGATSTWQSVAVTLADGSVVQAKLLPGCIVFPGDAVQIQSFRRNFFWQRDYLVLGPEKRK